MLAISSITQLQAMGGQEALTLFFCATACAAIGVTVVVTVGLIFSLDDLAIFSKFKGVITNTLAERAAILVVSAIGAGVGAQIGIAVQIAVPTRIAFFRSGKHKSLGPRRQQLRCPTTSFS